QTIENQARMIKQVKSHKAGFVTSDCNIRPDQTLKDVLELKERSGHSTTAVTEDGTSEGKLVGILTSRDYRVSRMSLDTPVSQIMTPFEKLVYAQEGCTLSEANDILWDNKLNALPIIDKNQRLTHFVFRKDYDSHKANPNELLDGH
ncbi:MAG: CBS domain-containing protein, partial [Anaerovoracaceae bacterium]